MPESNVTIGALKTGSGTPLPICRAIDASSGVGPGISRVQSVIVGFGGVAVKFEDLVGQCNSILFFHCSSSRVHKRRHSPKKALHGVWIGTWAALMETRLPHSRAGDQPACVIEDPTI